MNHSAIRGLGTKQAIGILHDQNSQNRDAINKIMSEYISNPLSSNLNAAGKEIKNIKRLQTTNSITVGTDIRLGGNIYDLEGNLLEFGGTEELFADYPDTYIVQNPIGEITQGTTVGYLKTLNSLSNVIAKMLDIQPIPTTIPTISGAQLSIITSNAHVKYGSTYPTVISISFNRGTWINAFESDGTTPVSTLPHNPGNSVVLNSAFGFNNTNAYITTTGITNSNPSVVSYSENTIPGTFNTWGNITLNAEMTTSGISTGDVYNNYGIITTPTPINQVFTAVKTWSVYKPVYVNQDEITTSLQPGTSAGSNPGLPGTVKVFSNTSDIIIIDHQWDHDIHVPAKTTTPPQNVYQYDASITNAWYNINFTAVSVSNYNGYGDYWKITLNIALRDDADVKISI